MKVLNPNTGNGKMIIFPKPITKLMEFSPRKMNRVYLHRIKEVMADVSEKMVIETQLVWNLCFRFSLQSENLYYKLQVDGNEKWEHSKSGFSKITFINIDPEIILMEGEIKFSLEIVPNLINDTYYNFVLIFKNTKDFIDLLKKHHIEYQYHSYSNLA